MSPTMDLPSWMEFQAAQGLELAQSFARARGEDAVPAGSARHRFWSTAFSLSVSGGLGDTADTLSRAAQDGVTPLEAGAKHRGLARVAVACDSVARARRKPPARARDALATPEALLQTGQVYDPIVDSPDWAHYAPIGAEPTLGMLQYQSIRMESQGRAEPSNDMSGDRGNIVTLTTARRVSNVAYFQVKNPGFDPLQMAQATAQGIDPVGVADREARRIIRDSVTKYILYSDAGFNWQGLLDTDTPTQITATALAGVTVQALADGIASTLHSAYASAAGGRFVPNRVGLSMKVWLKLLGGYDSAGVRSGQEFLKAAFPGAEFRGLTHLDDLANFDSGTKHGVIMAQSGRDGLHTVMSESPFVFTWNEGGRTVTYFVTGFAGTHFPHKAAFIVGDQAT